MDISEITNDPLWKLIFANIEDDTLNKTKGVLPKVDVLKNIYLDLFEKYFNFVKSLSDDDFDKLRTDRHNQIKELQKILNEMAINTNPSNFSMEEISAMTILPEIIENNQEDVINKLDDINLSDRDYEYLFILEFFARIELFIFILIGLFSLDTKDRIEKIIKKNFHNDGNWSYAVSILTIQENLVKKKLETMGMTKLEIKEFLKQKGNHFQNLVDHLEEKIKEKEKRNLSISFYKSHSLRDMRNKIEHEGFDVKVTSEDVKSLLDDIEKFEKELFPENQ